MANSPKVISFTVYDNTGAPLNGIVGSITFNSYEDSSGGSPSQPAFSAAGGGQYYWTPLFADPTKGIFYTVDCGASANPRYFSGYIRPEDWNGDLVSRVVAIQEGKKVISPFGANANQEVCYDVDGTTILQVQSLFDVNGAPTASDPYSSVPQMTIP
jgi:hypothetical protein